MYFPSNCKLSKELVHVYFHTYLAKSSQLSVFHSCATVVPYHNLILYGSCDLVDTITPF